MGAGSPSHGKARLDAAEALGRARRLLEAASFGEAEARLRELLAGGVDARDEAEASYMLAVCARYGGDAAAGLETIDALLAARPEHSRAHQERGHALTALGRPEDAAKAYERAARLNPGLVASFRRLAELHAAAGRADDAESAARRARFLERLPPELVSVTSFIHEGELDKADKLCRDFLQKHRHHPEAMRLLADIAARLKILDDAEFLLESCVELAPDYAPARADYVNLLLRKMKFEAAHEQARQLTERHPRSTRFRVSLATSLVGLGRIDEGIAVYADVLARESDNAEVHLLRGHAEKTMGDVDASVASYRRAYEARPDFGDAYWSLANIKTYRFRDAEIEQIQSFERSPDTATDDRIHMCFAAGKAFEDRGEHDTSFDYYTRGNRLKREQLRFDIAETERRIQAQIDLCTSELFERRGGVGCERPDPIFIVGLPRAGSTLLEQILASHSMVDGTMELHEILGLAHRLRGRAAGGAGRYPEILHELDDDYFRRFGEQFLDRTRVYRAGAPLFIDKMPNNFMHVGLIRLILPNAKVIDARRHPMPCCFSNFKQLFGEGQEFSYDLEDLGRYYRAYLALMDHWDRVLPGFVLRVRHEDVVDDLETQVRRMLEFCRLPFEPACLEFHRTRRSVRTPSSEQVRRPVYRAGVEQWRRFERHLEPLKAALGAEVLARFSGADD